MWGLQLGRNVVWRQAEEKRGRPQQIQDAREAQGPQMSPGTSSRRSSSPPAPAPALPPLREDAPFRAERSRAKFPRWEDEAHRQRALHNLDNDILASTTARYHAYRMLTVRRALDSWGLPLFPPSQMALRALGATLKEGKYHSAVLYFSAYKTEAERQGHTFDAVMCRQVADYKRSCTRGIGGPVRAKPLPFQRLV